MQNRIPPDRFELRSFDGLRLQGIFRPAPAPRAVVGIIHGLGEHYGRYHEVIRRFRAQGISCYAFDLRGHGRSDGSRGYAPSYDHLLDDMEIFLQKIRSDNPGLPIFLYGQSMGGNLVSNFLLRRNTSEIAGALITSPWLQLNWSMRLLWIPLSSFIKKAWPAQAHRSWLNPERLSSDPKVGVQFGTDELVHRRIHPRTFLEMNRAGRYAIERASSIDLPLYVAHGGQDPVTSPAASRRFAIRCRQAEYQLWDDLLHETHHEWNYDQVIDTMANWMLKQIEPQPMTTLRPITNLRSFQLKDQSPSQN